MKKITIILALLPFYIFGQAQIKISDTIYIDVVLVYEEVVKMGYESQQIYQKLSTEYAKRNDTINEERYMALAIKFTETTN